MSAVITIAGKEYTAEEFAAVIAAHEAQLAAARALRKEERKVELEFLAKLAKVVAAQFASRKFESGAEGWSFGGKVKTESGREATVSMLIRWTDTIPAKTATESAVSDAAAVASSLADVEA